LKQLSLKEEEILKLLPNEPFTTREIKSNRGNVKVAFILRSLVERGLVRRKGKSRKIEEVYIMGKEIELEKLNSMTKYPSILTYHKIDKIENRGRLLDEIQVDFEGQKVILTEKVDGVNGRIILFPDGFYIIGSREELLYAKGDLIGNPQLGIVDVLKPIAEKLIPRSHLTIFYFEIFGGKTTKNSKQYTRSGQLSCRLFDIAFFPKSLEEKVIQLPIEQIASWRDNGGQLFYDELSLDVTEFSLTLTPRIGEDVVPNGSVREVYDWLKTKIQTTQCSLDDGALGRPEGLVVRTFDRSKIAKIRFEDYERTMRK
jgi:predicted transcriptional regulator